MGLWVFDPDSQISKRAVRARQAFLAAGYLANAGSFTGSVDGGLIFERQTTLGGAAMTQTLEPRVYYLYSEFDEQHVSTGL